MARPEYFQQARRQQPYSGDPCRAAAQSDLTGRLRAGCAGRRIAWPAHEPVDAPYLSIEQNFRPLPFFRTGKISAAAPILCEVTEHKHNGVGEKTVMAEHEESARHSFTWTCLGTCMASCIIAGTTAMPAQAQDREDASTRLGLVIEEVVVTARKREESLQDTPISVTAVTASDMANRSLDDISSIAEFTANLEFSNSAPIGGAGNAAIVFIRGIGQTDLIITTDPGVGIFLDGVYIGRTVGGVFDVMDFERIEVLRGPQGTLFGKNTIG